MPTTKQQLSDYLANLARIAASRKEQRAAQDAEDATVFAEGRRLVEGLADGGTTPTPTPTPTPVPLPGNLYAEIGGIPAGASAVASGDVSKLSGNVLLAGTSYTASGGISANLYAQTPGAAVIQGKKGQQVQLAKNVKLGGVTFTEFGVKKSTDGTQAGVVTDDGCQLHSVEVTKSVGVGILFKGRGLKSYALHAHHNGTSGRMIRSRGDNANKGSGFLEVDSHLHHNNHGGMKSDAANKATQTSDHLCVRPDVHDEADGALWYDIACWNCVVQQPNIRNITTETDWYRAVGVRFELNAYGTYPSGVYGGYIGELAGSAVAVNESGNVEVIGVTFGKCLNTLELRQQTRDDDPGDGGLDPSKWLTDAKKRKGPGRPGGATLGWEVFDVKFRDNDLQPGAGPIALSGSNGTVAPFTKDLRLSKNRIVIEGNTGDVDVKVPT